MPFYYSQCDHKKIAKCLKKLLKNEFTRKMIDFDTFTKVAKECVRFGQINSFFFFGQINSFQRL